MEKSKKPSKTQGKVGSSTGGGDALQKRNKEALCQENEAKSDESNKIP